MAFFSQIRRSLSNSLGINSTKKRLAYKEAQGAETFEDRVLLTVSFQMNYIPSTPANLGFDDPTLGQARRDALEAIALQFGNMFDHTATIQMDVTSSDNPMSNTLASAGTENSDVGGGGFGSEVIRTKILTGNDLNGITNDGSIDVNWGQPWELSLDPNDTDPESESDFISTMMHELSHAVGFASSILENGQDLFNTPVGNEGAWNKFDQFITTFNQTSVIDNMTYILDAGVWANRTGGNSANNVGLFFSGPNAMAANGGKPVGLFTPTTWKDGSSVSHTDDENPALSSTMMLSASDFGPNARTYTKIERAILKDLGYTLVETGITADIFAFDPSTGRWRVGASTGSRFYQVDGPNWSTTAGWTIQDGDFNNDGRQDVAGLTSTGQWWVGLSNGTTFVTSYWGAMTNGGGWTNMQVGDFDNDGDSDILSQNSNGEWWLNRSIGSSFQLSYAGKWSASGYTAIVSGDFNNDGRMDISGLTTTGQWWTGLSNGNTITTSFWRQWNGSAGWQDIRVGDFNGDGMQDVFARTSTSQWWIGQSTGTSFATVYGTQWNDITWKDVRIGDFNGDGRSDIAARTEFNRWHVTTSSGTRLTESIWAQWNSSSVWATAVGDFNGDGKDDIAGFVAATGEWWVALSDNGTRFQNTYYKAWVAPSPINVGFIRGKQLA